ncbi:glycosyltransferase family 87 protein [Fuscibacter oryzae]|uniref:DUF2029 domain-containing protein n=1 Tax=Fuscibacter oryzae TaxID=2803939 RepID=A0A8J7SUT3_9RHOB|nr:glycosyltransferase family 87 protein [Fuscibacter oryzae]MBL4928832.1 DUF2029 domain-containing protein [Fuscibacter oryzae]
MTDRPTSPALFASPLIGAGVVALCLVLIVVLAIQVPTLGAGQTVLDFDAFYIAGQMGREGQIVAAYDKVAMLGRQSALAGQEIWMPWTYPPQFDLVSMALTFLPRGLSYLLFTAGTFATYLLVLRRIAGPSLNDALFLGLPAFLITAAVGQNGFLTGTLMGLFALGWLGHRSRAGVALGLMVIKPHLALGSGILAVVSGRWRLVAVTFAVIGLTSALATAILGPAVWRAFLDGTATAADGLKLGYYPLYRMTSLYAMLATFGVNASLALAMQAGAALISVGSIIAASRMGWPAGRVLGVTLIASMGISPYNYDYDMPILILGLGLLLPELSDRLGLWGRRGLFAFTWLCCGWGQYAALTSGQHLASQKGIDTAISLGSLGHIALLVLVWRALLTRPAVASAPVAA